MKVLIFDTETTGLPKGRPAITDSAKWPHIIQLSYILYDLEEHKILVNHDHIIKLDDSVELTEGSFKMHGISKEQSKREGITIDSALELFNICLKKTNILVAHNISFDKNMILAECARNTIQSCFSKYKYLEYCTMKHSTELCNIETVSKVTNRTFVKFPTLTELHLKLFETTPEGTHNSYVDILVCLRCFYKLMFDEDISSHNKKINRQISSLCNL